MAATLNNNVKEKILQATMELVQQSGEQALTLSDIAKKTKISKGTLYYYYSSKEEIYFDITVRYLDQLANEFIVWIEDAKKDTSLHRLLTYVIDKGAHGERSRLHFHLMNYVYLHNDALKDAFIQKYEEWKRLLADAIRPRLLPTYQEESSAIATSLLLMIDGIMLQELVLNCKVDASILVQPYLKKEGSLSEEN